MKQKRLCKADFEICFSHNLLLFWFERSFERSFWVGFSFEFHIESVCASAAGQTKQQKSVIPFLSFRTKSTNTKTNKNYNKRKMLKKRNCWTYNQSKQEILFAKENKFFFVFVFLWVNEIFLIFNRWWWMMMIILLCDYKQKKNIVELIFVDFFLLIIIITMVFVCLLFACCGFLSFSSKQHK